MATLSIHLTDRMAQASQEAAGKLGISRTEFIRQAIAHELVQLQIQLEQEAILKSIAAMKKNKTYLKEAEKIEREFNLDFLDESEEWWNKKKS